MKYEVDYELIKRYYRIFILSTYFGISLIICMYIICRLFGYDGFIVTDISYDLSYWEAQFVQFGLKLIDTFCMVFVLSRLKFKKSLIFSIVYCLILLIVRNSTFESIMDIGLLIIPFIGSVDKKETSRYVSWFMISYIFYGVLLAYGKYDIIEGGKDSYSLGIFSTFDLKIYLIILSLYIIEIKKGGITMGNSMWFWGPFSDFFKKIGGWLLFPIWGPILLIETLVVKCKNKKKEDK